MIYGFGEFELDAAKVELRAGGVAVAVEPQVFALLKFLIENRERMVTREEIIDAVWDGRIVSDAAVASRIKSARAALGDDGRTQAMIRTVRGSGLSFVAEVTEIAQVAAKSATVAPDAPPAPQPLSRPSIAVLPFRLVGVGEPDFPVADALPHDLITELSRLRWLFVIARASSFRFRGEAAKLENVRAQLNVRYCLTGMIEVMGEKLAVTAELSDAEDGGVVWSERFRGKRDDVHEIRDQIVAAVVGAAEVRIPLNEARRAQASPGRLDAWSAYHLGLHHMYRFTAADNARASGLFEQAAKLEPGFARAYAGLSFTAFQAAFLRYPGAEDARVLARRHAETCLAGDPLDPFGHLTMGRAMWLEGQLDASLPWLDRANALNPNYAQARYSRAWTEAMLGQADASETNADAALALSPVDPLAYAMVGVKAFSSIARDDAASAAARAEAAANAPGAHALIAMLAVTGHGLNDDDARARHWAEVVRTRAPHLSKADFLRSFPLRNDAMRSRVTGVLDRYGF